MKPVAASLALLFIVGCQTVGTPPATSSEALDDARIVCGMNDTVFNVMVGQLETFRDLGVAQADAQAVFDDACVAHEYPAECPPDDFCSAQECLDCGAAMIDAIWE